MNIWRQFASVFADLRAAMRPEEIAGKIYRRLIQMHLPEDVGDPGAPRPYCLWCKTDWPCKSFSRLLDAKDKAEQR